MENPPPGTIVDHTITRRDWYVAFVPQDYSRKIPVRRGGGGRGWEDGRQFIFVWVVGAEIFQIIWVIGVQPNLITWVVGVGYYRPKKERSFYLI